MAFLEVLIFSLELRNRFIDVLGIKDNQVIFPQNAQLYIAIGAALSSGGAAVSFKLLMKRFCSLWSSNISSAD